MSSSGGTLEPTGGAGVDGFVEAGGVPAKQGDGFSISGGVARLQDEVRGAAHDDVPSRQP